MGRPVIYAASGRPPDDRVSWTSFPFTQRLVLSEYIFDVCNRAILAVCGACGMSCYMQARPQRLYALRGCRHRPPRLVVRLRGACSHVAIADFE